MPLILYKGGILMKKILFSPIGGTDPISNFKDGAMLHICRVYQPDVVWLYMSKEMCEFHKKDNRYLYCLERLEEILGIEFEIHLIEKTELKQVQVFDTFIAEFREILKEINEKYEDKIIYLNVSSGTPAMKGALQTLATLSEFSMIPIQVSTPVKKINDHPEDRVNYEVEEYWELNEDNQENFENRCVQSEGLHLLSEIKKEILLKHVYAYDYVAAIQIAETVEYDLPNEVMHLLRAANCRLKLYNPGITKEMEGITYSMLPLKSDCKREIFEAVLALEIKMKKEEYGDFLRYSTPIMVNLFYYILKEQCHIDVYQYCKKDRNTYKWSREKLKRKSNDAAEEERRIRIVQAFKNAYGADGIREKVVSSAHMVQLIKEFITNKKMREELIALRAVEYDVRNLAAHQIVAVTKEWIQRKTGYEPEDIMEMIKNAVGYAGIKVKKEDWKSYDNMNMYIEKCMKEG